MHFWSQTMDKLTDSQRDNLAKKLSARKKVMREEISAGMTGLREESIEDILGGTTDAGDVSSANQLAEVSTAEVARDNAEMRDIAAAEERIAAGTYGICIDCGVSVPYARLEAYPTAKRCIPCQEIREQNPA